MILIGSLIFMVVLGTAFIHPIDDTGCFIILILGLVGCGLILGGIFY